MSLDRVSQAESQGRPGESTRLNGLFRVRRRYSARRNRFCGESMQVVTKKKDVKSWGLEKGVWWDGGGGEVGGRVNAVQDGAGTSSTGVANGKKAPSY